MKREDMKRLIPTATEDQIAKLLREQAAVYEQGRADAQSELEKNELEGALNRALIDAAAKNVKALMALLDLSSITLKNGRLYGFNEQLERLKRENGYLFEDGGIMPEFTAPTRGTEAMTARDFDALSYKKRLQLFSTNPELYRQLVK